MLAQVGAVALGPTKLAAMNSITPSRQLVGRLSESVLEAGACSFGLLDQGVHALCA